jgi:hypothetical protein
VLYHSRRKRILGLVAVIAHVRVLPCKVVEHLVEILHAGSKISVLLLLVRWRTLRLVLGRTNQPALILRRFGIPARLRRVTERIGCGRHLPHFLSALLAAPGSDAMLKRRTHSRLATATALASTTFDHWNLSEKRWGGSLPSRRRSSRRSYPSGEPQGRLFDGRC